MEGPVQGKWKHEALLARSALSFCQETICQGGVRAAVIQNTDTENEWLLVGHRRMDAKQIDGETEGKGGTDM